MMNKMTDLVNKIERRLGTKPLKLPEYPKDTWPKEIIIPDSLTTFSRYFPHMVRIGVSTKHKTKDGYFLIDQDLVNGEEIIGVRDIAFDIFGQDSTYVQQAQGLGIYDYLTTSATYSLDDVLLLKARADMASIFNNQTYLEFKEPNMVKVTSVTGGDLTSMMSVLPIDVFIKHPSNLMTIPVTQMGVFENLATADVALTLNNYLRHFDNLETVFGTVNINIDSIADWAGRRDEIENQLKEGYVNPANKNQPIMFTV